MSQANNRNASAGKRARTDGGRREDDWTCPSCGNVNFSFRTTCNMHNCTQSRPADHNTKSAPKALHVPPAYAASAGGYMGAAAPSSMYLGAPPYASSLLNGPALSPYNLRFPGSSAYPFDYGSRSVGSPYGPLHMSGPPFSSGSMMGAGILKGSLSFIAIHISVLHLLSHEILANGDYYTCLPSPSPTPASHAETHAQPPFFLLCKQQPITSATLTDELPLAASSMATRPHSARAVREIPPPVPMRSEPPCHASMAADFVGARATAPSVGLRHGQQLRRQPAREPRGRQHLLHGRASLPLPFRTCSGDPNFATGDTDLCSLRT